MHRGFIVWGNLIVKAVQVFFLDFFLNLLNLRERSSPRHHTSAGVKSLWEKITTISREVSIFSGEILQKRCLHWLEYDLSR